MDITCAYHDIAKVLSFIFRAGCFLAAQAVVLNKLGDYAKPLSSGFNDALSTIAKLLDEVDRVKCNTIASNANKFVKQLYSVFMSLTGDDDASRDAISVATVSEVAEQMALHVACLPDDFVEKELILSLAELMPVLCYVGT